MDQVLLRDAVSKLSDSIQVDLQRQYAREQAARQFNALLMQAKTLYPKRVDIGALTLYDENVLFLLRMGDFTDAVRRLVSALELRPTGSVGELFAQIKLPSDAPSDVVSDLRELEGAISLELSKSALLLAGSIAESLLLCRHPDRSEWGPGLKKLIEQAQQQRLFGRDTLRSLENLVDYRDLIHPRAEKRNKTTRNSARVEAAVTALKLLCTDLQDTTVKYG